MREDGVDRTDVDIVGRGGLYGVLEECLECENDILHALDVLNAMDKAVHTALTLGQFHLPVLVPELLVAHLGIGLRHLLCHTLEKLLGNSVERIVCQTGGTGHGGRAHETDQREVGGHVVLRKHPLTVRQLLILLQYLYVLHEINVRLLGDGHHAATHMERRVFQDIEVTAESHIVGIVGQEVEVDARVAFYLQRVLDVVAVEADAFVADG